MLSSAGARTRVSKLPANPARSALPGATLTTALSQMTDIRSSMPLVPSGIAVKLSFPIAFCAVLKVQWALPETCRSPLRGGGNKSTISCFTDRRQQGHEGHDLLRAQAAPGPALFYSAPPFLWPCLKASTRPCGSHLTGDTGARELCHAVPLLGALTAPCAPGEPTAQLPGSSVAFTSCQKMSSRTRHQLLH